MLVPLLNFAFHVFVTGRYSKLENICICDVFTPLCSSMSILTTVEFAEKESILDVIL